MGCTTDYAQSEVKYAVDAWAADKIKTSDLKVDATGYSARLLTYDELLNNLGYTLTITSSGNPIANDDVPNWVYSTSANSDYYTMSQHNLRLSNMWGVRTSGNLDPASLNSYGLVRPVVTLSKTAL